MSTASAQAIQDIHIGHAYDQRDPECDIHYETFARLADFFGRNTPPHRHYCFYQLHLLVRGSLRLSLDSYVHEGDAPLLIFTPPATPHSFYSEDDTDGHVLTVRQEVVRAWHQDMQGQWPGSLLREPAFLELSGLSGECAIDFAALLNTIELLQRESGRNAKGRAALQLSLAECAFIHLGRLLIAQVPSAAQCAKRSEDLRFFLNFCDLVEENFRQHLTLSEYAGRLSVTEARLNDICRRMANLPSKELVHERLLQEARRMLRYSALPINEISYQLGFADPAYFSRFFTKRTGTPPSQYRLFIQTSP